MLMHVSLPASLLILNPVGISGAHLLTYSFALAPVGCGCGGRVTAGMPLSQPPSLRRRIA